MTDLPFPPATALRTWLQATPPPTVLGQRCTTHDCPLVAWLRSVFGVSDVEVHENFVRVRDVLLQTPEWFHALVMALDYSNSHRDVTAEEVLRHLEQIMQEVSHG